MYSNSIRSVSKGTMGLSQRAGIMSARRWPAGAARRSRAPPACELAQSLGALCNTARPAPRLAAERVALTRRLAMPTDLDALLQ
ncbi:unnamed protein product [Leptosia nina]|uniref:Uncharacterized protein n=1 Tax=Leptosia nina TaxID=320188 RepID=A0AAV1JXV6_9NEOP